MLNTTIQDLRSKLESVRNLEVEKTTLENGKLKLLCCCSTKFSPYFLYYFAERDNALADLELKEIEISRVTSQIVELKTTFEKEETLRYEYAIMFHIFYASTTTIVFTFRLEATLKQATDDKMEMETQILSS